jgi:hypothetical protein
MDPDEFARRCADAAADSLVEIFGEALQTVGTTRAVPENGGLHSLGCCWARECELLVVAHNGGSRLKMRWRDRDAPLLTAVADLRGFAADHRTIDPQWVENVNAQLAHQERTLLAVGLSRAYRKSESEPAMHWLQVNNVLGVADAC